MQDFLNNKTKENIDVIATTYKREYLISPSKTETLLNHYIDLVLECLYNLEDRGLDCTIVDEVFIYLMGLKSA